MAKTLFDTVIDNNVQARDNKEGYAHIKNNDIHEVIVQISEIHTKFEQSFPRDNEEGHAYSKIIIFARLL